MEASAQAPAIEHVAPAPEICCVASAQPVTYFAEQTVEQIIDLPGPSIARDTPEVVSSSHDATNAAPAPVNEFLASVIEYVSSSSSAAHAAPTSAVGIVEMCERIEKETEKVTLRTKRYMEEPPKAKSYQPDGH